VMMLEYMGWQEAADLITQGLSAAIAHKEVTYDLARLMEPRVEPVSCSGFADAVIRRLAVKLPLILPSTDAHWQA